VEFNLARSGPLAHEGEDEVGAEDEHEKEYEYNTRKEYAQSKGLQVNRATSRGSEPFKIREKTPERHRYP
jgi:hypothetical protein